MAIDKDKEQDDEGGSGKAEADYQQILASDVRDDLIDQPLTQDEERLLSVHQSRQAMHVEQAKREALTRAERQKQAEIQQTASYGTGGHSKYQVGKVKEHPLLNKKASCVDTKVSSRTDENTAEANPELQNQLQHQHQLNLNYQPNPSMTLRRT